MEIGMGKIIGNPKTPNSFLIVDIGTARVVSFARIDNKFQEFWEYSQGMYLNCGQIYNPKSPKILWEWVQLYAASNPVLI